MSAEHEPHRTGRVFERLVHALKLCREQTNSCSAAGLQQNKLSKQRRKKKTGVGSAPLPHRSDEEPALCYTLYIQHSSSADEARVTRSKESETEKNSSQGGRTDKCPGGLWET